MSDCICVEDMEGGGFLVAWDCPVHRAIGCGATLPMTNYNGPGIYRHYKGNIYEVFGLALQEDTVIKPGEDRPHALAEEKTFVVYRPLSSGSLLESRKEDFWAREFGDFNAHVERDHCMVPRFKWLHAR